MKKHALFIVALFAWLVSFACDPNQERLGSEQQALSCDVSCCVQLCGACEVATGGAAAGMSGAPSSGSAGVTSGASGSAGSSGSGGSGGSSVVTYHTDFNLTEYPLSENGVWNHFGLDWTKVKTGSGLAFGTQQNVNAIDDSQAYLSGFPPNQTASVVVHLEPPPANWNGGWHEIEILLRWSDSEHNTRGYECNLAYNGWYSEIVRWNGPYANYTYLSTGNAISEGVHDGDVFSAQVVGNVITTYLNGVQVATATDSTWADGNPGIGFFRTTPEHAFDGDFAITSFTASGL